MMKFAAVLGLAAVAGIGIFIGKKLMDKKMEEDELEHFDDYDEFEDVEDIEKVEGEPDTDDEAEEDADDLNSENKFFCKEKIGKTLQDAGLIAVGTIKTGADKLAEVFKTDKSELLKAGEDTMEQAKEVGDNIKKEIQELKNKVTSINVAPGDLPVDEASEQLSNEDDIEAPEKDIDAPAEEKKDIFDGFEETIQNAPAKDSDDMDSTL